MEGHARPLSVEHSGFCDIGTAARKAGCTEAEAAVLLARGPLRAVWLANTGRRYADIRISIKDLAGGLSLWAVTLDGHLVRKQDPVRRLDDENPMTRKRVTAGLKAKMKANMPFVGPTCPSGFGLLASFRA